MLFLKTSVGLYQSNREFANLWFPTNECFTLEMEGTRGERFVFW